LIVDEPNAGFNGEFSGCRFYTRPFRLLSMAVAV